MKYSKTTGGFYDPATHSAVPADAVEISGDEHAELLAGQSAGMMIVGGADGRPALQLAQRSLEDIKATKIAEINAARLKANRGTFIFMNKPVACDELSRSDIDGANGVISLTGALPPGWLGSWKTATNEYIPVPDVATWAALYGAMVAQGTANFTHSQELKAQIETAFTAGDRAALEAVIW